MKDLIKLCRSLHTQREDGKKISDPTFGPRIEKSAVKLREAVENLGRWQPSVFSEEEPLKYVVTTIWASKMNFFLQWWIKRMSHNSLIVKSRLSICLLFSEIYLFILCRLQRSVFICVVKTVTWTPQTGYVYLTVASVVCSSAYCSLVSCFLITKKVAHFHFPKVLGMFVSSVFLKYQLDRKRWFIF